VIPRGEERSPVFDPDAEGVPRRGNEPAGGGLRPASARGWTQPKRGDRGAKNARGEERFHRGNVVTGASSMRLIKAECRRRSSFAGGEKGEEGSRPSFAKGKRRFPEPEKERHPEALKGARLPIATRRRGEKDPRRAKRAGKKRIDQSDNPP